MKLTCRCNHAIINHGLIYRQIKDSYVLDISINQHKSLFPAWLDVFFFFFFFFVGWGVCVCVCDIIAIGLSLFS